MPELDRRDFLKLVGVSAGGAAAIGCSDHVEKLIPYVVQPEEITPGVAVFYSSTCLECPAGCGLHVRTRESRPVKLEGNPDHPVNRGALCARGQAGIGRTYHPGRFRGPLRREADGTLRPIGWDEATKTLAAKIGEAGSGTRLIGGVTGPTLDTLIDAWVAAVGAGERVVYEPFAYEALAEASRSVFGVAGRPVFDLEGTDFVVDFGSDAMETWLSPVEHARQIESARDVTDRAGAAARMVYVGPRLSMTAGNADEWLPANPGTEGILALGLARVAHDRAAAADTSGGDASGALARVLAPFSADAVAKTTGVSRATIKRIGRELAEAGRPVALPPGVGLTSQRAVAANAAVLILNAVIGAIGRSVRIAPQPDGMAAPASFREVVKLVDAMKAGDVSVLLVHGSNPVYSLPAQLGFTEALRRVRFVVSFASQPDETTVHADLILPDHTPLESWGDSAPRAGVRSLVQPTIRPLYDTQAFADTLLATWRAMGEAVESPLFEGSFRELLEIAWADTDWRAALARGGVFSDSPPAGSADVTASVAELSFEPPKLQGGGSFILLAHPSPLLYDGRGADLPWLQETPDPVTKIAWQSWAELSRKSAKRLGVAHGDLVAIETAAGRLEVPVYPRGGIRDDVIAVAIGQGHTEGWFAARPDGVARGVNVIEVLPAATDEKGGRAWLTTRAEVTATGGHERLADTQREDNKRGRQLGEMVPLAAVAKGNGHDTHGDGHGDDTGGHAGTHEMRKPFDPGADAGDDSEYRWGMTIDLDRCMNTLYQNP